VKSVLATLTEAARRATEELVTEQRLDSLKTRKRYEFLMRLETTDAVAGVFARPLAIDGDLDGIERLHASYATLTPADIRDAARTILTPARLTTGVLSADDRA
jgi:predicted Zn-dependent peptidase